MSEAEGRYIVELERGVTTGKVDLVHSIGADHVIDYTLVWP
jgi:hypothetical protein